MISLVFFNQVLTAVYLNYSDTGVIYQGIKILIENLFKDYSFTLLENRIFHFVFAAFSFLFLAMTLSYVFNIKLRYLKGVKLLEPFVKFFYKKIFGIITFGFLIFKKSKNKKTDTLKRNKSEPVLHKNKFSLAKTYKSKEKKQNSEFDNYYYKLPSIDLFSQTL